MERDQVLAFRVARHGLATRRPLTLAEAAACPASDYARGRALLALAARADGVTREAYDRATDAGELVLGPSLRAAIHAQAPRDFALFGQALLASDDAELADQIGPAFKRHLRDAGGTAGEVLTEVAEATQAALADGRALDRTQLHAELRERVRPELLPWCKGCASHHVSPMLWRFAGVRAGMRCDAGRRFLLARRRGTTPGPAEAARRYLRFYGPATPKDLGAWAGIARSHARRLWTEIEDELIEVHVEDRRAWLLAADEADLASPPQAEGVRLLPPRDPYVQAPDRATLVPDPVLRKRLFRPIADPGAILQDGRLAGLWRTRAKGKRLQIEVEEFERLDRDALQAEADRIAAVREARTAEVHLG
ncbi:MAG: winged helix DNA-binding domain-containing protein [Solirubrobacterales bacterium]|nr:winged helix DNA-binding domain-containing protein [Solirubrobacterales bacterium]